MPSPKSGTVTPNIAEAIKQIKKGRVEFKLDKTGNIHIPVGKVNFSEEQLKENIEAAINAILEAKPSGVKGRLFKNVVITPTMGPGIKLDVQG
jgi:large subunit ribosomal protein L1